MANFVPLMPLILFLFITPVIVYFFHKRAIKKNTTSDNVEKNAIENIRKNFFRKLLSGDFGLAKTYWLYGVLARIVIISITMVPVESILVLVIQGSLIIVYEIIVIIGIWQAATKYKGLIIWAILAKVTVVFGVTLLIGDLLK